MRYIRIVGLWWAGAVAAAAGQACTPQWDSSFAPNPDNGVDGLYMGAEAAGPVLYVGGKFQTIGGQAHGLVAALSNGVWVPLGNGIPAEFNSHGFNGCCAHVRSFVAGSPGSGVIVAGDFVQIEGVVFESIARFGAGGWSPFAGGVALTGCQDCAVRVNSVVYFQGMLHAAGGFDRAGGVPAINVARWTGTSWQALGTGVGVPATVAPSWVEALAVYEEAGVPRLFAAGSFENAGALQTRCIVRWDGQGWSAVGGGVGYDPLGPVPVATSLAVYDDGRGPALYLGGQFSAVGGAVARNVARWDGIAWGAIGAVGPGPNDMLRTLAVFDDGRGAALYVGGQFDTAGGMGAQNIARWDGGMWEPLGQGVAGAVHAMSPSVHGAERHLYVGGFFTGAGGLPAANLARWSGCAPTAPCYANCDLSTAPPVLNVGDFTCFLQRFAEGDAYANCDQSTTPPVLNVGDFTCFLQRFAAGCR
jgi:trimeric autotransporter adhesin